MTVGGNCESQMLVIRDIDPEGVDLVEQVQDILIEYPVLVGAKSNNKVWHISMELNEFKIWDQGFFAELVRELFDAFEEVVRVRWRSRNWLSSIEGQHRNLTCLLSQGKAKQESWKV